MNEQEFQKEYLNEFYPYPEKKIFIVGGTPVQAAFFARLNGIPKEVWQYVSGTETLNGRRNIQVWFCGTWVCRSDARKIVDYVDVLVREKLAEIIDLPDRPRR